MTNRLNNFLSEHGDKLEEDAGLRKSKPSVPGTSALEGKKRAKNAAVIDCDRIIADEQHREDFDEEALERLAQSIGAHGQLQPIRVRWDEERGLYIIIAGERRWRACRLAGLTEVECVIADSNISANDILKEQVIENALREDLKPIEQAKAYRDLMEEEGWNGKDLAEELHLSRASVSNALSLLKLPEETQEQIESGDVAPRVAISAARKSRSRGKGMNSKSLKPIVVRTTVGKVLITPKSGRDYREVLEEALAGLEQHAKAA